MIRSLNILILFTFCILLGACYNVRIEEKDNWKAYFDKHHLEGGFEIYDNNKEIANYYNKEICSTPLPPGATFYIMSGIVGIETSTVLDENKPIYWVSRLSDSMDKESNLRSYFQQQDPVFHRHLAREIGPQKMQDYLDSVKYGNMTLSDGEYWNDGTLLISPDEQVGLMKRIYFNQLNNISSRSSTIMKSMMMKESSDEIKLYYQISPVVDSGKTKYWITGFAETYNALKNPETEKIENKIHPFFFAGLVYGRDATEASVKELMEGILKDYQVMK